MIFDNSYHSAGSRFRVAIQVTTTSDVKRIPDDKISVVMFNDYSDAKQSTTWSRFNCIWFIVQFCLKQRSSVNVWLFIFFTPLPYLLTKRQCSWFSTRMIQAGRRLSSEEVMDGGKSNTFGFLHHLESLQFIKEHRWSDQMFFTKQAHVLFSLSPRGSSLICGVAEWERVCMCVGACVWQARKFIVRAGLWFGWQSQCHSLDPHLSTVSFNKLVPSVNQNIPLFTLSFWVWVSLKKM